MLRFYPESIRGHIQHSVHTLGAKLYAEPAAIGVGAELSGSKTFSREGKHIIQGRLIKAQRTVKWTINENETTKSGIYEQPSFAIIVRYSVERGFAMKLGMKATTYGALSLKGKKASRTIFKTPDKQMDTDLEKEDLEELTKMRAELLAKEGPGAGSGFGQNRFSSWAGQNDRYCSLVQCSAPTIISRIMNSSQRYLISSFSGKDGNDVTSSSIISARNNSLQILTVRQCCPLP